jgi:hypothetical protein
MELGIWKWWKCKLFMKNIYKSAGIPFVVSLSDLMGVVERD